MTIQLLFIAAVGYAILWCATSGNPRAALREAAPWWPGRRADSVQTPEPLPAEPPAASAGVSDEDADARWNELIAGLDDLADLDHDLD